MGVQTEEGDVMSCGCPHTVLL